MTAVVVDVGETLVDETAAWTALAAAASVPCLALLGVLGGIAYVGHRRGPWGYLQARWSAVERAAIPLDSLAELPEALVHV